MSRIRLTISVLAVGAAFAAGTLSNATGQATAVREALAAQVNPIGAKGRTLALSRVTVPAGALLALHHHTGTQIARIDKGTLTYTVQTGSVTVHRGEVGADSVVRKIKAGQTGHIKAGQWIVEQPSVIHKAANKGTTTVVIYLATLLPNGDPPSVPNR
ncbi:MAG: Cupin 2 conserved barrel domain protein [Solirubrobacterales bacterium]|jgi:quercetin dioxygenase-like cupin family protein|nr:Cupin 2 conserved barrel domain protein [Solirubrobacterales bacterium]